MKRKCSDITFNLSPKKTRPATVLSISLPIPKYLSSKFPHSRDKGVHFHERSHTYSVDWSQDRNFSDEGILSVSGLYAKYFPKFDADKVISTMFLKCTWKTLTVKDLQNPKRVMNEDSKFHGLTLGEIRQNVKKTISTEEQAAEQKKDRVILDPKSKYFGLTKYQIKTLWQSKGEEACRSGTAHHLVCELFYNGISPKQPFSKCTQQFLDFAADHAQLRPFRTEWVLYSSIDYKIAGTPDMLFFSAARPWHEKGEKNCLRLTMFDWKKCKKLNKFSFGKYGTGPLDDLPNTNYFKYAIQQNCYKYLLENFYAPCEIDGIVYDKIEVEEMYLVIMHENNDKYLKFLMPNYQDKIATIFAKRKKELYSQKKKN
jgi:hypothetical protein